MHHYLLHYPSLIMRLGPLVHLWTLRFENKRLYFKQCLRSLENNHQLLQSYMNSSSFFPPVLQVKDSSPYHVELYSNKVHSAVEVGLVISDFFSKIVNFWGTLYKKGLFMCLNNEKSLEFGQLNQVLMK